MTITKDVMKKIEDNHVEPKARWKFLLKNYSVWVVSFVLLFMSSIVLSVVLYILSVNDWDVYHAFSENVFLFTLLTLPYLLLFISVIGFLLLYITVRHTRRGHRFTTVSILGVIFVLSFFIGTLLHAVGVSEQVDEVMTSNVPGYTSVINTREYRWEHPERGFIAGKVIGIPQTSMFILKDNLGKEWVVLVTSTEKLSEGKKFRVIGELTNDGKFRAYEVLNWNRIGQEKKINIIFNKKVKENNNNGVLQNRRAR